MRGLAQIPGVEELTQAYARLQGGGGLETRELALYSQWSRFDPRLAEQLVSHLTRHWRSLDPHALHAELSLQPWPAAMGVLLEQASLDEELARGEARRVRRLAELVLEGLPRGEGASFFIATRAFAGKLMRLDAELATRPYLRWGYLGRERLVNKASARGLGERTLLSRTRRVKVLSELVQERRESGRPLTVQDYRARLEALGGGVGLRQAELDLASHPELTPRGVTRGRVYLPVARRPRAR